MWKLRATPVWDASRRPVRCAALASFLVALALLPAGAAWATIASHPSPAHRPRLLVLGDSVVLGTYDKIPLALPNWDVKVDATVSRSTEAGLDALRADSTAWDVVVVELGANDGGSPAVFQPRVDALLGALAPVPHVVWLTIHEARPYYAGANDVIRRSVAAHPNASVGDWNAAIQPGDTGEDGLHLTPTGGDHMAAFVAGLASDKAPVTTTTTTTSTTSTTTTTPSTTTLVATTPPSTSIADQQAGAAAHGSTSPPSSTGGRRIAPWLIALAGLVAVGAGAVAWLRARAARAQGGATRDP